VLVSASRRNRLSFESRRSGSMQTLKKVRARQHARRVRYPQTRSRLVLIAAAAAGIIDPGYNHSLITSH